MALAIATSVCSVAFAQETCISNQSDIEQIKSEFSYQDTPSEFVKEKWLQVEDATRQRIDFDSHGNSFHMKLNFNGTEEKNLSRWKGIYEDGTDEQGEHQLCVRLSLEGPYKNECGYLLTENGGAEDNVAIRLLIPGCNGSASAYRVISGFLSPRGSIFGRPFPGGPNLVREGNFSD
ncbi:MULTISPECIES: hypothetical protein [unclassified Mesorhizobium]|uniref:hypothetical protein n=1 Tax=unclassified Mesorhizobium TaxID=325217 RepID=UPI0012EB8F1E|nr:MULTISPECIES: hypothetical protein [unclassified Mesorhizobium]WJI67245.1 hypothetical protein NLY36_20355 [Mesorhizobium sp. C399B]